MIAYSFESRQQVVVRGHHYADVVVPIHRKSYEIEGQSDVNALFLGAPLRIPELSLYYRSPVCPPALTLLSMSRKGAPGSFRVRLPRVSPHFGQSVRRAVRAASARDETPQFHGIQMPVPAGLRAGEEDIASAPVGVLIIDEQYQTSRRHHRDNDKPRWCVRLDAGRTAGRSGLNIVITIPVVKQSLANATRYVCGFRQALVLP